MFSRRQTARHIKQVWVQISIPRFLAGDFLRRNYTDKDCGAVCPAAPSKKARPLATPINRSPLGRGERVRSPCMKASGGGHASRAIRYAVADGDP